MKSTIQGTRYDTDNAILLGEGSSYLARNDFSFWEAKLYITPRSKKYFLAGSGGPMSRYARSSGQNSWIEGESIDPMTEEQAFEWAQEYFSEKEIQKFFGHLTKG